jgi:hypothetical protein
MPNQRMVIDSLTVAPVLLVLGLATIRGMSH